MRRFRNYLCITFIAAVPTCAALLAACYSHGETTCGQEDAPTAPLRGTVTLKNPADGGGTNSAPGAGSLVFVELCGLYTDNPNPSKGHPNYRYVALADDAGNFEVNIPKGTIGLHTMHEGYSYGFTKVTDSTASDIQVVNAEALGPRKPPTVKDFAASATAVSAGESVSFTLSVQAAPGDPISDEVLLAEPRSGFARAFAPPSRGQPGKGFPSGTWTVTIPAPTVGTYTYYAQATSEQCAVSERLSVTVTVK